MFSKILSLLDINPSAESREYVQNKKPFQLHALLTEQRHPSTWDLSHSIKENIPTGLRQIFSVDEDITRKFKEMRRDITHLSRASRAISHAIRSGTKIYIYGCGATGRLAKQMESSIWRPFWMGVKKHKCWEMLRGAVPEDIEDRLIGEMTGGDRALISALEGFEDLLLMGRLQLKDRGVEKSDAVFCITEGGETSSVIGAILAAAEYYEPLTTKAIDEAKNHLYFIYNNPDSVLRPYERSRRVIEHPAITKINLATGPQAIAGSTRMQATTSETYTMGLILETGIYDALRDLLTQKDLERIGFQSAPLIENRLQEFEQIPKLLTASTEDISRFTALEAETYESNRRVTYFAKKAMITVFTDCTERSPTFHLFPLDSIQEKQRKCWIQVWTEAKNREQAWEYFLKRNFRGLDQKIYKEAFEREIDDLYLRRTALNSLTNAGQNQEKLYDFSFSATNITLRGPKEGDLGVLVCVDEEIDELANPNSLCRQFVDLFKEKNGRVALVLVGEQPYKDIKILLHQTPLERTKDIHLFFPVSRKDDPLDLKRNILLKILLNAHSTGVMTLLGKVVGNTMTNVKPSNLKLIGRATYLIQSHVSDFRPISYAEANAVLFDAIGYLADKNRQTGEVELSIIRILETYRNQQDIGWDRALHISETEGLEQYLKAYGQTSRR